MSVEVALRHAFAGFSLDVAFALPGSGVTALFGASGAGKTTIVAAIAGTFRPREGRIVIAGREVLDTAKGIFVPPQRRRAGMVFQDARLFPHMSVRDNLLFGWRRAPVRAEAAEIDRVVALLGLEALLGRRPRKLSGGEKKPRRARPRPAVVAADPAARRAAGGTRRAAALRNPALSRTPARRGEAADALCQPFA